MSAKNATDEGAMFEPALPVDPVLLDYQTWLRRVIERAIGINPLGHMPLSLEDQVDSWMQTRKER